MNSTLNTKLIVNL